MKKWAEETLSIDFSIKVQKQPDIIVDTPTINKEFMRELEE